MSLSPAYDRRGAIGLFFTGTLGIGLAACSAFQHHVTYYPHDDLAGLIQQKTGVCVGVGDVSNMGVSYFEDMRVRIGVKNDAIRDYAWRCDVRPRASSSGPEETEVVWLAGGSVDHHGERKGPACVAVSHRAVEQNPDLLESIVDIAREAGVRYVDRSHPNEPQVFPDPG